MTSKTSLLPNVDPWIDPSIFENPLAPRLGPITPREGARASRFSVTPQETQSRQSALAQREAVGLGLTDSRESTAPGFRIAGGVGGTSAHLEDLDLAAIQIGLAVPCLNQINKQLEALFSDASTWAHRIEWDTQDKIMPWIPAPLHAQALHVVEQAQLTGTSAKGTAWDSGTTAQLAAYDIEDLAASVQEARSLYIDAEASAEESVSWYSAAKDMTRRMSSGNPMMLAAYQLSSVAQNVAILGLDQGVGWANEGLSPVREDVVEDLAFSLANPLPTPWQLSAEPSEDVPAVAGALTDFFRLGGARGPRTGIAVPTATPADMPVVRNVQDAAAGIKDLYRRDDIEPGSIGIQKNTLANGETTWVVMAPGTQGGLSETHQFDWLSNFSLMTNEDSPPTQVVRDAMRQAGIKSEEKVTMLGHSQGGLAVIDISNSQEFNVTHVLTMGTPTALRPSNPATKYLAVETQGDAVPALDASKNSDRVNQTTVRADTKRMDNAEGLEDYSAHSIENYCGVLEEVERLDDPSTTEYLTSLQDEIFDDPIPTSQGQYRSEPKLMTFRATTKMAVLHDALLGPFAQKATVVR